MRKIKLSNMLNRSLSFLFLRNISLNTKRINLYSVNKAIAQAEKKHEDEDSLKHTIIVSDKLKSKEYFLKDDPDVFGSLSVVSKDLLHRNELNDDGDKQEEAFLENPVSHHRKLSTKQYADIIKTHLRKRQIKEAIDVLEVKMIKEDRVKPENYIYNLILGGCGRVGYTKKAFKLFNDMKKRGLKPTNGTYTALFNACSNSPLLDDGLKRATKLQALIQEKGVILNDTNYNAMIKAFGRCGDIKTAFNLVDEMIENKIYVKQATLNFLLQSCISDTDAGFRHALLVWRKFYQKNLKPDIFSFNLMLKCIKDCSIGDLESMNHLLESSEFNVMINSESKTTLQLESSADKSVAIATCMPNLMAPTPYLGKVVKLNEITKAEDRLLLVGGLAGFLQNMKHFQVNPDIKTFTQLLQCIPNTQSAEISLLSAMKKEGIKYDIDFLNMLIKKRCMRFDYENAQKIVKTMFKPLNYRPNIITYGVLALSCETKEQAEELIQEMNEAGYRINIEILGAMLKQACHKMNFVYVLDIMELAKREQIKPNKIFIQHLEDLYKRAKMESQTKKGDFFTKGFKLFRMRYKTWLEEIELDKSEEEHPWTQFTQPTNTNVKHYKDKAVHFKPRITSRYRVKTGTLKK